MFSPHPYQVVESVFFHSVDDLNLTLYRTKKILDWSKFKTFADDKSKLAIMMNFVFDRVEKIVGKGENTGYQHFLLVPQFFQKVFVFRVV